ncbi:hypothetical protein [Streptomyces sp. NPDC051677]|uniref:hypothetical protein n=1 Tax=Streptomyces sp. NPDC051677 TaxID=3365669 RepID=UPI0037D92653
MAKRSRKFKNKKIRFVAIGAALATGAAVVALLPSANAADAKTPEQIMDLCNRAEVLNGKQQSISDFGGHPIAGPSFGSDNCDFVETNFETFNGPTEKASIDFPNCEPNATDPAKVSIAWESEVAQGKGKQITIVQGGSGGLLGVLTGSWSVHKSTLNMTTNSAKAGSKDTVEVPVGKVAHIEFTPKMQRMTGEWRVRIDAREATLATSATPEQNFVLQDVVEGPSMLAGAAGAPGVVDGVAKTVLEDC